MRIDEKNICRIYSKETVKRYKRKRQQAFFNERLVNPKLREIILQQDVSDKKIIDIGCGYGADLEFLLNHGAKDLTGTDINQHFLDEIKNNNNLHQSVVIFKRSIYDLSLPKEYDIAFSNMVLDQIEDLDAAFAQVAKVLKNKGVYVFSLMHPLNTATKDYKEELLDYFEKKIQIMHPKTLDKDLFVHQRTLEDISLALNRNKFMIHSLYEPRPIKKNYDKPNIYNKLPGALIICAQLIQ
jgi:SAM-dependent methyltransferase